MLSFGHRGDEKEKKTKPSGRLRLRHQWAQWAPSSVTCLTHPFQEKERVTRTCLFKRKSSTTQEIERGEPSILLVTSASLLVRSNALVASSKARNYIVVSLLLVAMPFVTSSQKAHCRFVPLRLPGLSPTDLISKPPATEVSTILGTRRTWQRRCHCGAVVVLGTIEGTVDEHAHHGQG